MCQKIAPSTAGSHAFSYARSGSVRATLRPLFIHSAAARARRNESASILRLVKNKVKQSKGYQSMGWSLPAAEKTI